MAVALGSVGHRAPASHSLWRPSGAPVVLLPQMNLLTGQADNFNRANGPIAGSNSWAAIGAGSGSAVIASNMATGVAGSTQSGNYRTDSYTSNQYSTVTIGPAALAASQYIGVSVRNQGPNDGYLAIVINTGAYQLQLYAKTTAGGYGSPLISLNLSGAPSPGTALTIIAEGSVISAYVGSPTGTSQTITLIDSTFTGGTPGFEFFGAQNVTSWAGGRAATGPFTSTVATDNFARANGLVSAGQPNWTDLTTTFSGVACNGASIASNAASAPVAQHYADYRNEAYSNDQWAQIAKGPLTPSGQPFNMGMIRWNGTSGYIGGLFDSGPPGIQIYSITSGTSSIVLASAATGPVDYAAGDVYQCSIKGSRIGVRVNGSEVLTVTDSSFTAGKPGFMLFGVTDGLNFAAGNV